MSLEQSIKKPSVEKAHSLVAGDKVFIPLNGDGVSVAEVALFGVKGEGTVRVTWTQNGVAQMRDYWTHELQEVTPESIVEQFQSGVYVDIPRSNGSRSVVQIIDRSIAVDGKLFISWKENGIDKSALYDVAMIKKVTEAEFLQQVPVVPDVSDVPPAAVEVPEVTSTENVDNSNQDYLHAHVKEMYIKYGVSPEEAERRTTASIDAAFLRLKNEPEKLADAIKVILENIDKEQEFLNEVKALEASVASMDASTVPEVMSAAPENMTMEELMRQSDVTIAQIDAIIKSADKVQASRLQALKGKLLSLDRRYKQYGEPNSIEKDAGIRAMMLRRTESEMVKVIQEAERALRTEPEMAVTDFSSASIEPILVQESNAAKPPESELISEQKKEKRESVKNMEELNQKLAVYTAVKNSYLTKLRDIQTLQQTPAREIMNPHDFALILANLETDLVQQKAVYESALSQIQFDFGDVYQDEVLSAEKAIEARDSFVLRLKNSKAALMKALTMAAVSKPAASVWTSGLRSRPAPKKLVEVVEGVILQEPEEIPSTESPFSVLAAEPVDPGVELPVLPTIEKAENEPLPAEQKPEIFTVEVLSGSKDAESRWSTTPKLAVIEQVVVPETIAAKDEVTPDMVVDFLKNYPGGESVRADAFESWVESVQGKHPNRFVRAFSVIRGVEHKDAFEVLQNMRMSDIRAIVRMPETARLARLHDLKIEPGDFEKWRRFLTGASMVPELKKLNTESDLFSNFAQHVFAYEALKSSLVQ